MQVLIAVRAGKADDGGAHDYFFQDELVVLDHRVLSSRGRFRASSPHRAVHSTSSIFSRRARVSTPGQSVVAMAPARPRPAGQKLASASR